MCFEKYPNKLLLQSLTQHGVIIVNPNVIEMVLPVGDQVLVGAGLILAAVGAHLVIGIVEAVPHLS